MIEEKKKRKKWFSIPASKEFRELEIGEVPANSVEDLLNKHLSVPLSMITNDFKKQGILITFRVTEIKDNKPVTEIKKIEMQPTAVKKAARRDKNKIDDSFESKTKDNISVKVKPLLLTRNKTKSSILSVVRKEARKFLIERINSLTYSDLVQQILNARIQKELRDKLNKIYPLSFCQIRSFIKMEDKKQYASPNNQQ